jgi:hypothetical protein
LEPVSLRSTTPHPTFADAKPTLSRKGRRGDFRICKNLGITHPDAFATNRPPTGSLKYHGNLDSPPRILQAFPNFYLAVLWDFKALRAKKFGNAILL